VSVAAAPATAPAGSAGDCRAGLCHPAGEGLTTVCPSPSAARCAVTRAGGEPAGPVRSARPQEVGRGVAADPRAARRPSAAWRSAARTARRGSPPPNR